MELKLLLNVEGGVATNVKGGAVIVESGEGGGGGVGKGKTA